MNPQEAKERLQKEYDKIPAITEKGENCLLCALDLALYALSRLIPVRPFEDGQGGYICNTVNCNTYLDKYASYCPMCGRPICWKEGE